MNIGSTVTLWEIEMCTAITEKLSSKGKTKNPYPGKSTAGYSTAPHIKSQYAYKDPLQHYL